MKRSAIEAAVAEAPAAFAAAGCRAANTGLGRGVADPGRGAFDRPGLTLSTLRNGPAAELKAGRGFCLRSSRFTRARTRSRRCTAMSGRSRTSLCAARPVLALGLGPGESVTLTPDIWHAFRGEGGPVVIGEVSSVNDDWADNVFETPVPRFPVIEEDAPARTPLVCERAPA